MNANNWIMIRWVIPCFDHRDFRNARNINCWKIKRKKNFYRSSIRSSKRSEIVANYHRPINRSRRYIRDYRSATWYNRVEISLYKGLLIEITFSRWCCASVESATSLTAAPHRCAKCNKLQNSNLSLIRVLVHPCNATYERGPDFTCIAETGKNSRFRERLSFHVFFFFLRLRIF